MNSISFIDNKKILITGGAGFIGGCLIRRLLKYSKSDVFNLDKLNYASDLESINKIVNKNSDIKKRYKFFKCDLSNKSKTKNVINKINPDIIIHFAAESHVDRSIHNPSSFIESNILGTYNLLEASLKYWETLSKLKKQNFKFLHISTDEVFGSLTSSGKFNEETPYSPNSPYSASKASSDHLVQAWNKTYNFPTLITNCSNNYGPWQFPEKLIPLTIFKSLIGETIPIYGDGQNIRDWLHVEDHINALLSVLSKGTIGETYCIGGFGERKNIEVVNSICNYLDKKIPSKNSYSKLIKFIKDRPGHDLRYSIDSTKINKQLNWIPKITFEEGLISTINWYLENKHWLKKIKNLN